MEYVHKYASVKEVKEAGYESVGSGFYKDSNHHLWRIESDEDGELLLIKEGDEGLPTPPGGMIPNSVEYLDEDVVASWNGDPDELVSFIVRAVDYGLDDVQIITKLEESGIEVDVAFNYVTDVRDRMSSGELTASVDKEAMDWAKYYVYVRPGHIEYFEDYQFEDAMEFADDTGSMVKLLENDAVVYDPEEDNIVGELVFGEDDRAYRDPDPTDRFHTSEDAEEYRSEYDMTAKAKYVKASLVNIDAVETTPYREDYSHLRPGYEFSNHRLILSKQDGTEEIIDNPTVSELPNGFDVDSAGTEDIKVEHEGILNIPEGKNFWSMSQSHYINLAKNKGKQAVMRALTNLERWNKNDDPDISAKARKLIDGLKNNKEWQNIGKKSSINKHSLEDEEYECSGCGKWFVWSDRKNHEACGKKQADVIVEMRTDDIEELDITEEEILELFHSGSDNLNTYFGRVDGTKRIKFPNATILSWAASQIEDMKHDYTDEEIPQIDASLFVSERPIPTWNRDIWSSAFKTYLVPSYRHPYNVDTGERFNKLYVEVALQPDWGYFVYHNEEGEEVDEDGNLLASKKQADEYEDYDEDDKPNLLDLGFAIYTLDCLTLTFTYLSSISSISSSPAKKVNLTSIISLPISETPL